MAKTLSNVAWGLEFGGSAVRLVRVTRQNSGYYADKFLEVPLEKRWEEAGDAAGAVGQMGGDKVSDRLVACVSDELVLFRTLSLPEAQTDVLEKMVQGQLEVLIPTQGERLATGYRNYADPYKPGQQRVLLCAARRDTLAGIVEGCKRLGREPDGIVPSVLALAAMWSRLSEQSRTATAIIDVGARCTSIALVEGGEVVQCGVLDSACDHWTEQIAEKIDLPYNQAEQRKLEYAANLGGAEADPAVHECLQQALAEWAGQLREMYEHCVEEIPQERRPKRCIAFGRPVRTAGVPGLIARTLGLEVVEGTRPKRLSLAEGMDFGRSGAAIGAALWAMESDWPVANLAARPEGKQRVGAKLLWWRWAALAAWLLGAMLSLYGLDKVEAGKQKEILGKVQARTKQQGGLDRQLAMGRYLEMTGPAALDALDRISEVLPEKTLLSRWRYSHDGEVRIEGTVPNEKAFVEMLQKLGDVGKVDPKGGQPEKKTFRFEVQMSLGRTAKKIVSETPAKEGEEPTTEEGKSEVDKKEAAESSKEAEAKPSTEAADKPSSKTSKTTEKAKSATEKN